MTGALWWARPGLYRIHTFVWFAVQTSQNAIGALEWSSGYLPLDLVPIAACRRHRTRGNGIGSQASPRQLQDLARQSVMVGRQSLGLVGVEQVREAVIDLAIGQSCFTQFDSTLVA